MMKLFFSFGVAALLVFLYTLIYIYIFIITLLFPTSAEKVRNN